MNSHSLHERKVNILCPEGLPGGDAKSVKMRCLEPGCPWGTTGTFSAAKNHVARRHEGRGYHLYFPHDAEARAAEKRERERAQARERKKRQRLRVCATKSKKSKTPGLAS
jgi:hypothetical protein